MFGSMMSLAAQAAATNPELLAGSGETQWWKELGTGYTNYLTTLKSIGVNPTLPARAARTDANGLDPSVIQRILANRQYVSQFGANSGSNYAR